MLINSHDLNNFSEWEDLYFLVVLVPAVGISHLLGVSLQNINCGVSEIKGGWLSLWSTQFQINLNIEVQAYLLYLRFRLIKKECINIIVKKTKMGDFFLLYMMGLNIDAVIFKEWVLQFWFRYCDCDVRRRRLLCSLCVHLKYRCHNYRTLFKEVVQELARKLGYHNKDIYES